MIKFPTNSVLMLHLSDLRKIGDNTFYYTVLNDVAGEFYYLVISDICACHPHFSYCRILKNPKNFSNARKSGILLN